MSCRFHDYVILFFRLDRYGSRKEIPVFRTRINGACYGSSARNRSSSDERIVLSEEKITKSRIDASKYTAWKEGELIFRGDLMDEMAKIDVALSINDEKFNQKVLQHAKDSNLPITIKNIKIHEDEDNQKTRDIIVSWSETVDLFGLYQHTYQFKVDTRE